MTDRTHPDSGHTTGGIVEMLHARIAELKARVQELGAMARENRSKRIVELEAQLEALRAGGVNGPLMGQPQEMPDLTTLTERGAKAWAGVDAQGLREGVASAGSEPVAWPKDAADVREFVGSHFRSLFYANPTGMDPHENDVYELTAHDLLSAFRWWADLHHSPPERMVGGWRPLPGTLPEPGTPVLLDIGKKYPIRAMWTPAKTLEASNDSDDVGDYDEATDAYYCPEGWYEWNEHEEIHWRVTETPRAWAPLPPTTAAGSGKGE